MARVVMVGSLSTQLTGPVAELLGRLASDIADDARLACPVDSGALKASIRDEVLPDGRTARVHADAKARDSDGAELDYTYALYVEEGTRHMAPQPFLRTALYRKRSV